MIKPIIDQMLEWLEGNKTVVVGFRAVGTSKAAVCSYTSGTCYGYTDTITKTITFIYLWNTLYFRRKLDWEVTRVPPSDYITVVNTFIFSTNTNRTTNSPTPEWSAYTPDNNVISFSVGTSQFQDKSPEPDFVVLSFFLHSISV